MTEWNFFDFASKDNLLEAVREQSDGCSPWRRRRACGRRRRPPGTGRCATWSGTSSTRRRATSHGFDAAHGRRTAPDPLGVSTMNEHVDDGALAFHGIPQDELITRLDKDRAEMLAIMEGLDADAWGGFLVPHKYMGPLPSCFYPVAQLVDYTVHSWDIRQGTGQGHAMDGDAADLLVPFCFIVWQSTADCADVEPCTVGIRVPAGTAVIRRCP